MKTRLAKALVISGAILVNFMIAADVASAREKVGWCYDGEGETVPCCVPCFFFCGCEIVVE